MLQIHRAVAPNGDQVGHIVHAAHLRVAPGDTILDGLLIFVKVVQQRVVVGVQKLVDAQLCAVDGELPADDRIGVGPQRAVAHIQPQRAISQHIQPFVGVYTDKVQPQLRQTGPGGVLPAVIHPALEPLHQFPELVVPQLDGVLGPLVKAIRVDGVDEAVIGLVGRGIQPVAGGQVIQHPQISRVCEQRCVFAGVIPDIGNESLIHRAPGAVHNFGCLDAVNVDGQVLDGQQFQVQAVHRQRADAGVQPLDGDPVFCLLGLLVFVLNAEPLALMDGAENAACDVVHLPLLSAVMAKFYIVIAIITSHPHRGNCFAETNAADRHRRRISWYDVVCKGCRAASPLAAAKFLLFFVKSCSCLS